jgi:hypothetical protein
MKYLAAIPVVIVMMILVITKDDVNDYEAFVREYCELSSMWLDDKARGVDEFDRRGHPPYKREIDCRATSAGEQGE